MWRFFGKPRSPATPPDPLLRGTPTRPRTKTYSAETGFVYQYSYRGYRFIGEPDTAREHNFTVSRDRCNNFTLRICIRTAAIEACEHRIGRTLLDAEQYAIAKLTLFETFDTLPELRGPAEPIVPSAAEMENHLRLLGRV